MGGRDGGVGGDGRVDIISDGGMGERTEEECLFIVAGSRVGGSGGGREGDSATKFGFGTVAIEALAAHKRLAAAWTMASSMMGL